MITIETNRLIIRNFDTGDWQDLQEMIIEYQGSEYAKYDHKWPTTTEEVRKTVEWFASGDNYLAVCPVFRTLPTANLKAGQAEQQT